MQFISVTYRGKNLRLVASWGAKRRVAVEALIASKDQIWLEGDGLLVQSSSIDGEAGKDHPVGAVLLRPSTGSENWDETVSHFETWARIATREAREADPNAPETTVADVIRQQLASGSVQIDRLVEDASERKARERKATIATESTPPRWRPGSSGSASRLPPR